MVFCNEYDIESIIGHETVTILILVDGFLQYIKGLETVIKDNVTILILVDGFLQSHPLYHRAQRQMSHNPYFSRWFSAMTSSGSIRELLNGHNPYFSRWFSAI